MLGEEDLNPQGFHMHEPGTRVTSMMAPTIVLRDGEVELALGSAGSNRLRSAILQVIRYVVDYDMDVAAGGAHGPHALRGRDPARRSRASGRRRSTSSSGAATASVRWSGLNLYFGGAQAARRDPVTGALSGAGDPRRGGVAVVVD